MGSDIKKPRAACVEDCDEEDKVVRGTKQSASTKTKTRGERRSVSSGDMDFRGDSGYSSQAGSDKTSSSSKSTRVEVVKEQNSSEKESRRKSTSSTSARSPRKSSRPPLTRNNMTSPSKLDTESVSRSKIDPSYYGVSPGTTFTPNSSSVRSTRPVSCYGGMPMKIPLAPVNISRPPLAPSAYYPASTNNIAGPTSYPLASPADSYMRYAPRTEDSYFAPEPLWPNHLAERFARNTDPIPRTASAQAIRTVNNQSAFELDPERRNSIRRRNRELEDFQRMPPPAAPRRQSVSRVVDERDVAGLYATESYRDMVRHDQRPSRRTTRDESPLPRAPRRPSVNRSSTYDTGKELGNYRLETSGHGRRSSYYDGQPMPSNSYEDKYREAAGYQEQVAGGPPVSLTAEALRKQQRTTTSSRSTRSSGSRDESDFKRSATTRTTTSRVDGDGEDITIRLKGGATVNIAGAEIKCEDGAEVNIVRSKSIRNGSERSGSEYGMVALDDRRGRDRRASTYSRSTSKSGFSNPLPIRPTYSQAFF